MPIYEYRCCACNKVNEELSRLGEITSICPECGHYSHKVISAGTFKINGHSEANGYSWCGDGPVYKS